MAPQETIMVEETKDWLQVINGISERCDLHPHFLKEARYQHKVPHGGGVLQRVQKIISDSVFQGVHRVSSIYCVQEESILMFAWHKVLHVFGTCNETVVAKTAHNEKFQPMIIPVLMRHNEGSTSSVIECIKAMEGHVNSLIATRQALHLDQIKDSFCFYFDSAFLTSEDNFNPVHYIQFLFEIKEKKTALLFNDTFFSPETASGFLDVVHVLLEQIALEDSITVKNIEYLPNHQHLILDMWNKTDGNYPSDKRLNCLFESSVENKPTETALIFRNIKTSYKDLNRQANQLAYYLRFSVKIQPEELIGLFLEKSDLTVVTILGVWKAGGAFVPIDTTYPDERVLFSLADTKAKIVLSKSNYARKLQTICDESVFIIDLESIQTKLENFPAENIENNFTSQQLAYITYTSGTTGVPKGIAKFHHSLVNSITDLATRYKVHEQKETVVLYSTYVFEPFYRQMLMALIHAHTLVIVEDSVKLSIEEFSLFMEKYEVTYLNGTASILQEYNYENCRNLLRLVLVGEELTKARYNALRQRFKKVIINEYGFTESAFVSLLNEFGPERERDDKSIGKPLRNVKCYVLNEHMKRVPIGAIGELHIGGAGISSGYLNREELTKEKFIFNPFRTAEEKMKDINRMIYKTGDLVRFMPNGEIEFFGRNDFQIKLRGIRIEPGEIETVLSKYPGIDKAVVVVKSPKQHIDPLSSRYLVAYFESKISYIREKTILAALQKKLPLYMVPNRVIQVNKIPNNINGKVDFRSLPDIEMFPVRLKDADSRSDLDRKLCQIWSEVLQIPANSINIDDDFFMLGGHSITCIQLISQIRQRLSYICSVEEIFCLKTIKSLSDHLKNIKPVEESAVDHQDHKDYLQNKCLGDECSTDLKESEFLNNIPNKNMIENYFFANSLQQGMVYHHFKQSIDDAYIMQNMFEYNHKIDEQKMKCAWHYAQAKYCSLRLRFFSEQTVLQVIDKVQQLDWRFYNFADQSAENKKTRIDNLLKSDREEHYKLSEGKLFRVYLVKLHNKQFNLIFSCHHIILDGWSLRILYNFVNETYLKLTHGEAIVFANDTAYIEAQDYLQSHRKDNLEYWENEVSNVDDRCNLNCLLNEENRSIVHLTNYDFVSVPKKKSISIRFPSQLKKFCAKNHLTLHSVLQFAWHEVLHSYGNGMYTVVGTTLSGRNIPIDGIETSVGMFINTVPLIVFHGGKNEICVLDSIKEIQRKVNEMNSHSYVNLGQLKTGELKHGMFDSIFVLENYPCLEKSYDCKKFGFTKVYNFDKLDYALVVIVSESENEITFAILYAGELFDEITIGRLLELLDYLVEQVVRQPNSMVSDLKLVSTSQQILIDKFNQSEICFPSDKTLHEIFEEEVSMAPDKVAIIFGHKKLTYKELNNLANQLSHYLKFLIEIKPGDLIAIFMDKSDLLIAVIFSIWKSGAAYVPIDTGNPIERVKFIFEDTKVKLVISNSKYVSKLKKAYSKELLILDIDSCIEIAATFPQSNPTPSALNSDLAYVIYTSGTTGNPKGVMVEHKGVVNLKFSLESTFELKKNNNEVFLSFSNYVFDHFVEQLTDALLNGQTLAVLNDEMREDKPMFYSYMIENKVTYLSGTPSVICEYDFTDLLDLTRVDVVGEDLTYAMFNKIRSTFKGLIINGYGPTEISITSHKKLYPYPEVRKNKSIGMQVANSKCYILNRYMNQVPIGAIGEMFIGGVGVARGYLNREDLTGKKFLKNIFQTEKEKHLARNSRIYATGDLVRWLENGEIEYFGRNDMQVKIRGIRVELGEIESILASYPGVTKAAVITKTVEKVSLNRLSINKSYIIGFCVVQNNIAIEEIEKYMQSKLPLYMMPNRIVKVDKLAVTSSGKLNYKLLPDIDVTELEIKIRLPRNEIEHTLRNIWAELLEIPSDNISIDHNFFNLGGDSFMIIKEIYMIKKELGCRLTVPKLLQNLTIEELSLYIVNGNIEDDSIIKSHSEVSIVSYSQESLVFIENLELGTNAYNILMAFELPITVNKEALKVAIFSVILKHEVLRTIYPGCQEDGIPLQRVISEENLRTMFSVNEVLVEDRNEFDKLLDSEAARHINIGEELPIQVSIFVNTRNTNLYHMSVLVHHIAFDAWSKDIFLKDLQENYDYYINNGKLLFQPLPRQYKDYALWQRKRFSNKRGDRLLKYWISTLDGMEILNFKPDFPRPAIFDYSGSELEFKVTTDLSNNLRLTAQFLKVSLNSLLISAYTIMLSRFTNQRDIVIGLPVSSRNGEFIDLIGFFINMTVLRVLVNNELNIGEYVRNVNRSIIQTQINQELPFEKLIKELNVEREQSRHPLVQNIFSYDVWRKTKAEEIDEKSHLKIFLYEPQNRTHTSAKFDISTSILLRDGILYGKITYANKLFHQKTIKSLAKCYQHVLNQISKVQFCNDNLLTIKDVTALDKTNEESVAGRTLDNSLYKEPSENEVLHRIFENAVETTPNSVAVVFQDKKLSYQELNERANQLAHYLNSIACIEPDDLITLFLDKTEMMIVSILAVWKVGAAYVPIDPSYPLERIQYILNDTGSKIIIANGNHIKHLRQFSLNGVTILEVDCEDIDFKMKQQPVLNCISKVKSRNLAYVIYTSGTTGKPKGVLIEHRSVANFKESLSGKYFQGGFYESVLFLSNYVFDFSVEQIMLSIFSSNKMIIPTNSNQIDDNFYKYMNDNGLTFLSGTPTFLLQINLSRIHTLKFLLVAGENFTASQYAKFREMFKGTIANAYGTTETTVYNMVQIFDRNASFINSLGQTLLSTNRHVLDYNMHEIPQGAIGELHLSGDCLARGYLNKEDLTQKVFVTHLGKRMYKTGDMVRYSVDGHLEYLGRNDSQVSIHGLRVEIGEIENIVSTFPSVKHCVIVPEHDPANANNTRYLTCYISPSEDVIDEVKLKLYLEKRLPLYMIPANIICINGVFPVTINGKLDIKALSNYKKDIVKVRSSPTTEQEKQMCQIWSKILGVTEIGIEDDFFISGGDSILSMQVVYQIRHEMKLVVSVKDIFVLRTIRRILGNVNAMQHEEMTHVLVEPNMSEDIPLLPIQKWFFNKNLVNVNNWNQIFTIKTPPLDIMRLKESVLSLIKRHDVFHLCFKKVGNDYKQVYVSKVDEVQFISIDISVDREKKQETIMRQLQKNFSIANGPLYSVVYLYGQSDNLSQILFVIHHLIVDTVSWRVLARDLEDIYEKRLLVMKGTSYSGWATMLETLHKSGYDKTFWKSFVEELRTNVRKITPEARDFTHSKFTLGNQSSESLLTTCHEAFDTKINDLLLTGLGYALKELSGDQQNYVTLEGHGREHLSDAYDVTNTVGWFTTMYPVKIFALEDMESSIITIKQHLSKIPNNGIGFGLNYEYSNDLLPNVTFNYLGQFDHKKFKNKNWFILNEKETFSFPKSKLGENNSEMDYIINGNSSAIDVTVVFNEGKMIFNIASRLSCENAKKFSNALKRAIDEVIDYTLRHASKSIVYSSLGNKEPTQNPLKNVFADGFDPFVEFESLSKYAPVLFILPPGEGGAESYLNNIVPQLAQCRLILFNNLYLYKENVKKSFEELANYYISYIKKIQPRGPYNLLGWSFGGVLSLEISIQLTKTGDTIDNLIMIDSFFNVKKALDDINIHDTETLLDVINTIYVPCRNGVKDLITNTKNFCLLKAAYADQRESNDETCLFKYYINSAYNNLDTILPSSLIQVLIFEDTHFAWVKNKTVVTKICDFVCDKLH